MTILHLMLEKCCEDACNISSDDHLKGGFRDVVSENALLGAFYQRLYLPFRLTRQESGNKTSYPFLKFNTASTSSPTRSPVSEKPKLAYN